MAGKKSAPLAHIAPAQVLVCRDCGEEFVLTSEARQFLEERGMVGTPQWCRSCFVQMKRRRRMQRRKSATPLKKNN